VAERLVLAHRGWRRGGPENSLAAIQAAEALRCHGAEFDVRRLKDGTLVLHHDADVKTPEGRRPLSVLTWAEFETVRLGATRLRDVVEWARQHPRFWLDVEVKEEGALASVLELLAKRTDHVTLTSFDLAVAARAKRAEPERRAGWISDERRADLAERAQRAGLDLLVIHRRNATADVVADAQTRGLDVWVWGVDWRFQARALERRGVHAFISDAPRRLLRT